MGVLPGPDTELAGGHQSAAGPRLGTTLTIEQFRRVTGLDQNPDFLMRNVSRGDLLTVDANGEVSYTVRGIHAKVDGAVEVPG